MLALVVSDQVPFCPLALRLKPSGLRQPRPPPQVWIFKQNFLSMLKILKINWTSVWNKKRWPVLEAEINKSSPQISWNVKQFFVWFWKDTASNLGCKRWRNLKPGIDSVTQVAFESVSTFSQRCTKICMWTGHRQNKGARKSNYTQVLKERVRLEYDQSMPG